MYFDALNTIDTADLLEQVIKAQGKTELLTLYFGHEKKGKNNRNVDLYYTVNNDNKNSHIVGVLSSLSNKLYQYYRNVKSNKLKTLDVIRDTKYRKMQDHVISYNYGKFTDEGGIVHEISEPIFDEEYEDS